MKDIEIAMILIEELEDQIGQIRGTKGYGVGHPHWSTRSTKQGLGSSNYEPEEDDKKAEKTKPVEVSRAFKK